MANDNNNNRARKVSRQSWQMNSWAKLLRGIWIGLYSAVKIAAAALATVLVIVAVCLVVFVGLLAQYLKGDIMPQAGVQIENFDLNQTSYAYYIDSEGNPQRLQKIYADTSSEWADIEDIPEDLIHAAVAIEDKRFYEHQGVDWFTTIKACINMFVGSGDQFGGSSITQQLIKNILLTEDEAADDVTVQRKILEIFRATEFERRYDKDVVMEYYLNYIYLGNRCNGVKSAAAKYFGKELEHLTAAECACLISITNNPSKFDPYRTKLDSEGKTGYEQNKERMTNTLWVMRNEGWLTEEEYQEALAQEIVLKDGIDELDKVADCVDEGCGYHGKVGTFDKRSDGLYYCPQCGTLTTIGEDASQEVYSWFVDTVLEDVAAQLAARDGIAWDKATKETKGLYKKLIGQGGYHIYTTLDIDVQNAVDKIYKDLKQIPATHSVQQLQSGIVIINNATGDIVAMAGGVGDDKGFDDWNCATDAKLQPGSSIKPLTIYAPAFEFGGITPATVMKDMPLMYNPGKPIAGVPQDQIPEVPFPKNDEKTYSYSRNILSGIMSSVNAIAVNTLDRIGLTNSFTFAKEKFGLSTLVEEYVNSNGSVLSDIAWSPLGMGAPTVGVTVRDMSAAYATFANNGVYREARTFLKVYDSDGNSVLENTQDSRTILSEKTVQYMNFCLDQAVNSGTGWEADISGQDVAGKTGTTTSKRDRWFCGYTDYYTAAVWCGYRLPEEIRLVGSGNPAAQLFKKVMQPIHTGLKRTELYDDSKFVQISVCLDSGKLATEACSNDVRGTGMSRVVTGKLFQEDMPTEVCDKHVTVEYCGSGTGAASVYCKNFAAVHQTTIVRKSLVKMTQKEVYDIVKASKAGLSSAYAADNYVYLVDGSGKAISFHGMAYTASLLDTTGKVYTGPILNEGIDSPYLLCTEHTQEAWEAYLAGQTGQQPTDPTEGEQDTDI